MVISAKDIDNNTDIVETEVAFLKKVNEFIVIVEFRADCNITRQNAAEVGKKAISLFNGGKFFSIIDGTKGLATLTNETLTYSATDETLNKHRMAQAIIVDNIPLSMIANFYLKFKNPKRPVKVFDKIHKAYRWLESQQFLLEE